MKSIEITTSIVNGRFKRNQNLVNDAIRSFEGKTITITLKVQRKERSISQNNYYWGVIVTIWRKLIQTEWGEFFSIDETHEFLKYNCNYIEKVDENTGEIIRLSKSTKDNSTTEQEEFHSRARTLAYEYFQCEIPLPKEQIKFEL